MRSPRASGKGRRSAIGAAMAATALVVALVPATPAGADETTVDCSNGDNLQTAINDADPGDTLVVSGICVRLPDFNFSIGKDLTLVGPATLESDGGGPVLTVRPSDVSVTIDSLTITNGDQTTSLGFGGGIHNRGTVNLHGNSSITGNTALFGGGIFNEGGTVNLHDKSSITDNTADGGSGIVNAGGTVSLYDKSSITDNTNDSDGVGFFDGDGGGILNAGGTVNLYDKSSITDNTADGDGGGIFNRSTVNLHDKSSVTGNTADRDGGGIYNLSTVNLHDKSSVTGNDPDDIFQS